MRAQSEARVGTAPLSEIDRMISEIRHLLPIQNPLYAYLHNNILINFEDQYFFRAIERAAFLYRASPYLKESYYTLLKKDNKITPESYQEAESNEKWRQKSSLVESQPTFKFLRNHKIWETQYAELFSRKIHDFIIPILANFLDQGLSQWQNPWKKEGLWAFFKIYVTQSWHTQDWFDQLKRNVLAYQNCADVRMVIQEELLKTGLDQKLYRDYLLELCFDLKGWSGMINKLETEPEMAPVRTVNCTLLDYLAVRILCENALNEYLAQKHHISLQKIQQTKTEFKFDFSKNRILHEALEFTFRDQFIQQFSHHLKSSKSKSLERKGPQALFCIDDREESIRRHLEAIDPQARTYGVVGFFGVDMVYHPIDRAKPTRQCPPVVTPKHQAYEVALDQDENKHISARIKSGLSPHLLKLYYQTRAPLMGFFHSLVLGSLSFFPLVLRILFPKLWKKISGKVTLYLKSKAQTQINLQGNGGYTEVQMAKIVKTILFYAGITQDFAPLVYIIGHGSTNTNNPFKQAYGCGACSGNSGFPNSKAFCLMANRKDVRNILRDQGIAIPESTLFVPAFHDTCSEEVTFDLSQLSFSEKQKTLFKQFEKTMTEACERNALERTRLFQDTRLPQNQKFAHEHVKARSMDLAQPRPEYGHSRVSLCIVGRRNLTLGLNLDRRAFLTEYDPSLDSDGSLLEEVAVGAVPVAANISLDYYFSKIDNEGFGAGTKLPLNITSLLGVMRGSKSDLRIGLGRQMVEIHEPLRILVLIEAKLTHIERLLKNSPRIRNLVENKWILFGRICPDTKAITYYNEQSKWVSL